MIQVAVAEKAPDWTVKVVPLPEPVPAVACLAKKVVLINAAVRPAWDQLRQWLGCTSHRGPTGGPE